MVKFMTRNDRLDFKCYSDPNLRFLPRDADASAERGYEIACRPSVCPSVCPWRLGISQWWKQDQNVKTKTKTKTIRSRQRPRPKL